MKTDDIEAGDKAFAARAAGTQRGFLAELWGFLLHSKKWWLGPILLLLLLMGSLIALAGTSAAPFIYTLF